MRLTPRPLATRAWRVCNLPGAINATVARGMAELLLAHLPVGMTPQPVLNVGCGSATLMIEAADVLRTRGLRVTGCDTDADARACAQQNLRAAKLLMEVHGWDATAVPLPDASLPGMLADLPFGQRVGSHGGNLKLYPQLLAEAARLLRPGAPLVLITHELRLMQALLPAVPELRLVHERAVTLRGLHPHIFVLER